MNREEIMKLACDVQMQFVCADGAISWVALEKFAALIDAHEREACAKVCEAEHVGESIADDGCCEGDYAYNNALRDAAAAIRARSAA